jgi:hypothetical protein
MKPKPEWLRPPWIAVNIVLFSLYAVFDMASFFWLRMVHVWWIIIMYTTTVLFNCRIVFGSITRIPQINYFVVLASFLMVVHLMMFITYLLSLTFAYQESSKSLYSLFFMVMSRFRQSDFEPCLQYCQGMPARDQRRLLFEAACVRPLNNRG